MSSLLLSSPFASAQVGRGPDFNGDGFADLAVSTTLDAAVVSGAPSAGDVNVIYGSSEGLKTAGNQLWTQDSPGVLDVAEALDQFGQILTWEDFNADGFTDLAVGIRNESLGVDCSGFHCPGAVSVLYGMAAGLSAVGNQLWGQDSPGVADSAERSDRFGGALAAGDFNGDGVADLAVGIPGETLEEVSGGGAVEVLYGSVTGLDAAGSQFWNQDSLGVVDTIEPSSAYGRTLISGDFNDDGFADLAIGVAKSQLPGGVLCQGAVNVLYGSASGLSSLGNQLWSEDSPGIPDSCDGVDLFAEALASSDFNADGFADLVVGAPGETRDDGHTVRSAGAVTVLYGSADGLEADGSQLWRQGQDGVVGAAEDGDNFGASLTAGDFDGDGFADLAIGVGGDDVALVGGKLKDVGAVNILYGSPRGLSADGNRRREQDSDGVPDRAEAGDFFGRFVSEGDFNGDGFADLVVGVVGEDIDDIEDAGAVNILYGARARGFSTTRSQLWSRKQVGVKGEPGAGLGFGRLPGNR